MTSTDPALTTTGAATPDPRRWLALAVLAGAQLMIVLDASIVNIALPSAQNDLGISDANRQWVITAYTLAFGALLLLGGRIADFAGRKRTFLIGLGAFAIASLLGGLTPNQELLFAARALQGASAALMAPAALSLITVTFTEPRERARAFGVFGALSGGGAAIGLIVGGVLTEYSSGTRRCARPPTPDSATPGAGFSSRCRNGPSPADRYPPTSTSTYSPTVARGLLVTDDDATRVVDAVLLPLWAAADAQEVVQRPDCELLPPSTRQHTVLAEGRF